MLHNAKDVSLALSSLKSKHHLSENMTNFMGMCLKIEPGERISAGRMLNHPWLAMEGKPLIN